MLVDMLSLFFNILSSSQFLFITMWCVLTIKLYLMLLLISKGIRVADFKLSWLLLLFILLGAMVGDIAWISKLTRQLIFPFSYKLHIFIVRCSWAAMIIQYQSLALFTESLIYKKYRLHIRHYITTAISTAIALYILYIACCEDYLTDELERHSALLNISSNSPLEFKIMLYATFYLLICVIVPSLFFTFKKIKVIKFPKILKKQLAVLITNFLFPFVFIECLMAWNVWNNSQNYYNNTSTIFLSVSTILLSFSLFYCIRKILRLRFLNLNSQIDAPKRANFADEFKEILEQLSKVSSLSELSHITQHFFKKSFDIPSKKVSFFIRNENSKVDAPMLYPIEQFIEDFMHSHGGDTCIFIKKSQILTYDELTFNNFYEHDEPRQTCINFLETINADLFVPIYQKQKIIAYIIVEINARPKKLYTPVEHDEILVFANYLSNIINLLQTRNIDLLTAQERELKEELYYKDQEIMQYKESMRSFLRINHNNEIGILFYKNRRIMFGNQAAKELIKVNLNLLEGHPLGKAIRSLGKKVEEYKIQQTTHFTDYDGKEITISGIPNLEQNNVIITLYHSEISDVVNKQLTLLKDPTKWDYILYLETTKAGQLINQLIPGTGETLINFKINLLQFGISNKALLLDLPEDDTSAMAEILHHISLREVFHQIVLTKPVTTNDYTIKLFGISPVFSSKQTEPSLFEILDNVGTLFIKNINFLDKDTQEYLFEYLKTGYWRAFKSDQKKLGNIRIIFTSSQDLTGLIKENKFSAALYDELKKISFSMPPLTTLSIEELHALAEGFSAQNLSNHDLRHALELNESEKNKLIASVPTSLLDIKKRVQALLITKSKKHILYKEEVAPSTETPTDPELVQAASLGKHALRDERIMAMLWDKFKNQNQIASFLGVNRSSVNRRCKMYNLV